MHRSIRGGMWLFLAPLFFMTLAPTDSKAQSQGLYFALKPGVFWAQGDIKDADTRLSGELAFGKRYSPNLSAEMNVGWTALDDFAPQIFGPVFPVGATAELDIYPFALTFRGILPLEGFELYGLAGIGAYYTKARVDFIRDSDFAAGFTAGAGAQFNISPSWFAGAEAKYLLTSDVTVFGTRIDLDSIIIAGMVGFRY
jgi:hypothetical protein